MRPQTLAWREASRDARVSVKEGGSYRSRVMVVPREAVVEALRQVRQQVRWRPGKAQPHLAKRVALGHLPAQATVATYEALIQAVVQTPTAVVWLPGTRWRIRP